jgi:hypothetical protein
MERKSAESPGLKPLIVRLDFTGLKAGASTWQPTPEGKLR